MKERIHAKQDDPKSAFQENACNRMSRNLRSENVHKGYRNANTSECKYDRLPANRGKRQYGYTFCWPLGPPSKLSQTIYKTPLERHKINPKPFSKVYICFAGPAVGCKPPCGFTPPPRILGARQYVIHVDKLHLASCA